MKRESIFMLLGGIIGAVISNRITYKKQIKERLELEELSEKHKALFLMMNQWIKVKQEGKNLYAYFIENGYNRIAVYGLSFAGETLLNDLRGTPVQVAYGIDNNAEGIYLDLDIVTLDASLDEVDAVVVTAVYYFEEIRDVLSKKIHCRIISLEDILYEL